MKIVNDLNNSDPEDVWFYELKCMYSQDLDCTQLEKDYKDSQGKIIGDQVLTLEAVDGGGGKFFRLTTDITGWSFSTIDELVTVLNHFKEKAEIEC